MDLGHRVVAMVAALPKRVICLTCGSEHNYRAPASVTAAAKVTAAASGTAARKSSGARGGSPGAGSRPSGSRAASRAHAEWEATVRSGRPFRDYRPTERYAVGELLKHPKFGDGHVVSLIGPNKLTIAFSSGERTLIHAPSAESPH